MKLPIQSNELYSSPEFKALCDLLHIPYGLRTVDMTIHMPRDGSVEITHVYQAGTPMLDVNLKSSDE